jgi:diadenosine tetraphosphate (Ap4A) HIT family hydrolase
VFLRRGRSKHGILHHLTAKRAIEGLHRFGAVTMTSTGFALDPRLAGDTVWLCDWTLSSVLLMNDQRYPWLVLVPRQPSLVEPFDLSRENQERLWREVGHAGALLKRATGCRKINIGALGNIVSQLHVHVIARNEADAAWPSPVWGKGTAERFEAAALMREVERLRGLLQPPV